MGKRYFCDYCDRSFQDNLHNRKKHLNGLQHLKAKKAWYDMFRGGCRWLAARRWGPALGALLSLSSDKEAPWASGPQRGGASEGPTGASSTGARFSDALPGSGDAVVGRTASPRRGCWSHS